MESPFFARYQAYAPVFLRVGLAIVFFLFGLQKLMNPAQATAEIQLLMNFELADAAALNYYLGLLEMSLAAAFLFGFLVRIAAFVAALLLTLFFLSFFVKLGLSINPELYRDLGLLGSALALFLLGAGPLSIDQKRRKAS